MGELKRHLCARRTWLRALYMLLFAAVYSLAEVVLIAVALFQLIHTLLTGATNPRLVQFGRNLCLFMYQTWRFLTFTSEELPFPFAPWPDDQRVQELTQPLNLPPSNFV